MAQRKELSQNAGSMLSSGKKSSFTYVIPILKVFA